MLDVAEQILKEINNGNNDKESRLAMITWMREYLDTLYIEIDIPS